MAKTHKDRKVKHIDPNTVKSRDLLMVLIINGVTKSGIIPDKRKARNKRQCRDRVRDME